MPTPDMEKCQNCKYGCQMVNDFSCKCDCHRPAMECKDCKAVDDLAPSESYCPKHNYKRPAMEEVLDNLETAEGKKMPPKVKEHIMKILASPATTEKWEERFDEEFPNANHPLVKAVIGDRVKSFIRQTLKAQKAVLVERAEALDMTYYTKGEILALLRREEV